MFNKNNFLTSALIVALPFGTPVLADAQSTQILEEYFGFLDATPLVLEVGDKEDAGRYSQWNNITLKSPDDLAQIAIPWVKVSKKLLGGFELTYAEKIDGLFQSPDPKFLDPIKYVIESKGTSYVINGKEGARNYASSFDEITFRTLENQVMNISTTLKGGTSEHQLIYGDMGKAVGQFNINEMILDFTASPDGQNMSSASTINGFVGRFEFPLYKDFGLKKADEYFDLARDMYFEYAIKSGTTAITTDSPAGPIDATGDYGEGVGFLGVEGSSFKVSGTSKDLNYNVNAATMGLPPMQFSIAEAEIDLTLPMENLDQSKPARYKTIISELNISDQVWALFDPTAILPRESIDLNIDMTSDIKWLKKMSEIDEDEFDKEPPIIFENAKIDAFNLKIAGAEMETTGSFNVDNSLFPPVPDGTVSISLKGGMGLLVKLTELGFVPEQNAAMIQGMSGMFFKSGGDGTDHLISEIEMTKDGHVSANGMPLK